VTHGTVLAKGHKEVRRRYPRTRPKHVLITSRGARSSSHVPFKVSRKTSEARGCAPRCRMPVPGWPCSPRSRTERRGSQHSPGPQNRRSVLRRTTSAYVPVRAPSFEMRHSVCVLWLVPDRQFGTAEPATGLRWGRGHPRALQGRPRPRRCALESPPRTANTTASQPSGCRPLGVPHATHSCEHVTWQAPRTFHRSAGRTPPGCWAGGH
jgi:hypothetical protein